MSKEENIVVSKVLGNLTAKHKVSPFTKITELLIHLET
jgi:hypothetical protein